MDRPDFPSVDALRDALAAAGVAHHEYETIFLNGVRDEMWPGFYTAYLLGSLGDFLAPSEITRRLVEAPSLGDWAISAARHMHETYGGA